MPQHEVRSFDCLNRRLLAAGSATLEALANAVATLVGNGREEAIQVPERAPLGPPVLDPPKILCVGLNYREHPIDSVLDVPDVPVFFAKFAKFAKFANALVGATDRS